MYGKITVSVATVLLILFVTIGRSAAQTTGFTYQGALRTGGNPATGQYDFQFKLFDALTAGNQIGSTVNKANITVAGGVFTVTLDFGASAFTGADRWLEISAKLTSDSTFTTLTPRQQITPAPYTIQSLNAAQLGGVAANQYVLTGDTRLSDARTASSVNFNTATLNGVLPLANGGTGSPTQTFVDLSNNQNIGGNKNFTGILTGNGSGLSNVLGTFRWQVVTGTSQQAQPNNGYAVNNASQVTITLPASPNVGDTVRISGLGTGGWKIAQNVGQSILGAGLNLSGVSWTPRDTARNWVSVACSSDGNKMVAVVGGQNNTGQIYTSTDGGVSWTARDSNRKWTSVASSNDGTKLVATTNSSGIYTSTDSGLSWTQEGQTTDPTAQWSSIASSADGTKLVAVAQTGQILTSIDSGSNWTSHGPSKSWFSVASSADGSKLVAAPLFDQLYTSTDSGVTWTPRDSSRTWFCVASSADGSKLVAGVGGSFSTGQIYTSTDSGITWTPRESNRHWESVDSSADGTKLVAVTFGGANGQIFVSTDSGISWTPRDTSRNWESVATSADGTKMIAVVLGGQIYTSDPQTATTTTTSGTSGFLTGGQSSSVELQFIGNGQFLVISHEGIVVGF